MALFESRLHRVEGALRKFNPDLGSRLERWVNSKARLALAVQVAEGLRSSGGSDVRAAFELMDMAVEMQSGVAGLRAPELEDGRFLYSTDVSSLSGADLADCSAAYELVHSAGWAPYLDDVVGLVCQMSRRQPGEFVRSWANPRMYCTVHLDFTASRVVIARDLIHEATHVALNDFLVAHNISLDMSEARYYSPWKEEERPAFGFLHSILTFGRVVAFLNDALPEVNSNEAELVVKLAQLERDRLRSCKVEVEKLIDDDRGALVTLRDEIRNAVA